MLGLKLAWNLGFNSCSWNWMMECNGAILEFGFKEICSWHWTHVGLYCEFGMMIVIFCSFGVRLND